MSHNLAKIGKSAGFQKAFLKGFKDLLFDVSRYCELGVGTVVCEAQLTKLLFVQGEVLRIQAQTEICVR